MKVTEISADAASGAVLMLGFMYEEALRRTIAEKEAYYWSRSCACLWHKGKSSGLVQEVIEISIDDDFNLGQILDELMSELVEPKLIQPTFVIDYPKEISHIAKEHRNGDQKLCLL